MEEKFLQEEEQGAERSLPFLTKADLNKEPAGSRFAQFELSRLQGKNTFGREEKLKSLKIIDQLFKEGKSVSQNGFTLVYLITPLHTAYPAQAGFSVPKKFFKHAVDRNRIKRWMREAYRSHKFVLYEKLVERKQQVAIMWVYKGKELPGFEVTNKAMTACLKKLVN